MSISGASKKLKGTYGRGCRFSRVVLFLTCLATPPTTLSAAMQGASSRGTQFDDAVLRAQTAQQADRFAEAAAAYAEATGLQPSVPELWANRGLMEHFAHQPARAIASFEHALALNPKMYPALLFSGLDQVELNQPKLALPLLKKAQNLAPKNADTYDALGRAYMELNQPKAAAASYSQATSRGPSRSAAWYGLGAASLALIDQAGSALSSRYAQTAWSLALYADELLVQERFLEAIDLYRQAAEVGTAYQCAIFAANLLRMQNRETAQAPTVPSIESQQKAFSAILDLLEKTPASAADSTNRNSAGQRASEHYLAVDPAAGAAAAARERALHPDSAEALYWTIKTNEVRAVDALTQFERLLPQSAATYDLVGDLFRSRMQPDSALAQYAKALALDPHDLPALLGSATAYLQIGDLPHSSAAAQAGLMDSPNNPQLNLLFAETLVNRHHYAEAQVYLERSLSAPAQQLKQPGGFDSASRVHALLGEVYAGQGNRIAAIAEMQRGLTSDRDGSLHYQLSRVYRQQGMFAEAKIAEAQARSLINQRRIHASVAVRSFTETLP